MAKSFSQFLIDYQQGVAHADLTDKLEELFKAVQQTGKAGELTFKIKVKPATKGDVDKVTVDDVTTLKLPKPERGSDFFWLGADAEPMREHPKQQGLKFNEVERQPAVVHSV